MERKVWTRRDSGGRLTRTGEWKGMGLQEREEPRTMLLVLHCCHHGPPQLTWLTTTNINYLTVSIGQSPGGSCGSQEAKIKVSAEL